MTDKVKAALSLIFIFLISGFAHAQSHPHLSLLSHLDAKALSGNDQTTFSSLWGYTAPDGREYAIIGSADSIYFVDVTLPRQPVIRGRFAGKASGCTNREFKTYSHYCYAVSDVCGGEKGSLQIYDLQYLPDSVRKVADNDSICLSSHTLYIEGQRLYLDSRVFKKAPTDMAPMSVYSLADPLRPSLLADITSPIIGRQSFSIVHDMHALHDTAYLCCGTDGLWICDLRNPKKPAWLQIIDVGNGGAFNHSCWVTENSQRLVFTDENNYVNVKLYDLSNLRTKDQQAIELISVFDSHAANGSVAHNAYFKNNLIWMSYYQDGVVVFDWSDENHVKEIASYDTYPQNGTTYSSFQGCWNVYPYLPSGNVIASDITNGLFVVRLDTISGLDEWQESHLGMSIVNNPCSDKLNVNIDIPIASQAQFQVFNALGQHILTSDQHFSAGGQMVTIDVASLKPGFYILRCTAGNKQRSLRFIKQ